MKSRFDIDKTLKALREGLIKKPTYEPRETFNVWKYLESIKIVDKHGDLVSLLVNDGQAEIIDKILTSKAEGRPPRFICCKSRRVGVSTAINAFIFSHIHEIPLRYATVVAHDLESAIYLFGMHRIFYENLPNPKPTKYETKREYHFEKPHYSFVRVGTAGNRKLFSSMLIHYCLFSEFAKWDEPEDPYVAASQCIPPHPDSLMFIESTAWGSQNMFHLMWLQAQRGEIDFEPIFLEWRNHKEYFMPLAPRERLILTPEEAKYQKRYGLNKEQMKWMVWTKKNQCRNDQAEFDQEYPIISELAFKATGTSYFDKDLLMSRRMDLVDSKGRVRQPPDRGELYVEQDLELESDEDAVLTSHAHVVDSQPSSAIIRLGKDETGRCEIWKYPEEGYNYVIGADVAEGVRQDYSNAHVIKVPNKLSELPEQVAKWRSPTCNATDFGVALYMLGLLYNEALICVERTGPGGTTLSVLEHGLPERWRDGDYSWTRGGYPFLFYERTLNARYPRQLPRMGFVTTRNSKSYVLQLLKSIIADDAVVLNCPNTIDELGGFIKEDDKQTFKQTRQDPVTKRFTDDEVMSLAFSVAMLDHIRNTLFFRKIESSDF